MEDQNDVVGHALLSDNHLLTAVYDKVAALVKSAFIGVSDDFLVIQISQMAEFRPHHDWHSSKEDLLCLVRMQHSEFGFSLFHFFQSYSLLRFLPQFDQLDVHINFCSIGEVPDSRFVREHWLVAFIDFKSSRILIHVNLFKDNFIEDVLLLPFRPWYILRLYFDAVGFVFLHNFLDIHLQKPIEGRNLLRNETMLLKIGSYHCPGIFLVDFIGREIEFPNLVLDKYFFRIQHLFNYIIDSLRSDENPGVLEMNV